MHWTLTNKSGRPAERIKKSSRVLADPAAAKPSWFAQPNVESDIWVRRDWAWREMLVNAMVMW